MFSKETCEMTIKILSTCYPLQFWEYSPAMELLSNHDGQAEFMDRLISLNGMKDFLIAYAKEDVCPPYEFSDDLGIIIGCVFSKEDKRTDRVLLLGPTFANDRSLKRLLDDLEIHDLSVSARKYMFEQFKDYPIIPINIFEQYLLMLHNAICDECLDFPAIRRKNFYHTKKTAAVPETNIATKAFMQALEDYKGNDASIRHLQQTSYKLNEDLSRDHAGVSGFEQQLVAAVEQGNMGLLDLIKEGGKFSNGIKIQLENDLQRCKYGSISLLTLCSRAAIRGGLSASISYSLMDTYTLAIDNCANVNDIRYINDTIFADYITRVHDAKQNEDISAPIRACIDYINLHIRDKITIKDLSHFTGYSDYYLSHKFKEELGITVNQYVQKEKLAAAKVLLTTEHMNVTQVAEALHFCSQSYFSNLFQKKYGVSPSQYHG